MATVNSTMSRLSAADRHLVRDRLVLYLAARAKKGADRLAVIRESVKDLRALVHLAFIEEAARFFRKESIAGRRNRSKSLV
jgi:hypothetical protein